MTSSYRIITTMDGIPICKDNRSIMQFLDTKSCRDNAKNYTFKKKTRHHSRGLTKDQFFRAKKEFETTGVISMMTLGRKGDHN